MASLKTIRKRIASVKSTQQITKAMKLVAASKLRRAQESVLEARPFARELAEIVDQVLTRVGDLDPGEAHPLMAPRAEPKRVELLVLTSDRGLCGGFNSNVLRRAVRFGYENADTYEEIVTSAIGRRGAEFLRRRTDLTFGTYHEEVFDHGFGRAEAVAEDLAKRFLEGELDGAYLLYNRFLSAISQEVTLVQLLPIVPPEREAQPGEGPADFEYEPSKPDLLEKLLPHYLGSQVWQAVLESVASEHGARMTAMDNATRNAGDMIDRLTLLANRTRQAAITTELMEIVSGAEALK